MFRWLLLLLVLVSLNLVFTDDTPPKDLAVIANDAFNGVILNARVITYEGLSDSERNLIGKYCCHSKADMSAIHPFTPNEAYYIRSTINAKLLARLSFANSCQHDYPALYRCTETILQQKIDEIMKNPKVSELYGTHRTRVKLLVDELYIPRTSSCHVCQSILSVTRDRELGHDEVIIGPIPMKPDEMVIAFYYNSGKGLEKIENPRRKLL